MVVKSLGLFSLAKIMGIIYAFFGFIAGLFFSFFALMGAFLGSVLEDSPGPLVGMVFGIGSVVLFPILYGVMGFIGGIVTAGIYNITARWVGGLEIELEEKSAVQ
ncbi:MAG: hypothetical protein JSU85_14795 [Candidatus Zixiibacteriota bacterium]|nr:MAG: hypothetical protein JSU85_14795 [candidate division Zixibacteria bacterium]